MATRGPSVCFPLLLLLLGGVLAAPRAAAGRTVRPLFEPTDLEMEDAGVIEVDLQLGFVRGPAGSPSRVVVPDFEVDLGLTPGVELDLDGAYAVEGPQSGGPFSFDHAKPDSFFPSLKVGLFDRARQNDRGDDGGAVETYAVAMGLQAGPKLPVAAGAHGVGAEGLALLGLARHRWHLALNLGGFIEPAPDAVTARPKGLEGGLDLDLGVGAADVWAITGELSAVRFLSADPAQLLVTGGLTWSATPELDLSLVALAGMLGGSDRYGLLLGLSPTWRLFGAAAHHRAEGQPR